MGDEVSEWMGYRLVVQEAQGLGHMPVKVPVRMNKSLGAASLMLGALLLAGCNGQTTCYGTEPDGEVEKLRPCPEGWRAGDSRNIEEDQYKHLEVVDIKNYKKKGM